MMAELLTSGANSLLDEIRVEQFETSELSEQHRQLLDSLLAGKTDSPFSRIGWIDEAMMWMESVTCSRFSSKSDIVQWNGGAGFMLLRARSDHGRHYWLKATGGPNRHCCSRQAARQTRACAGA